MTTLRRPCTTVRVRDTTPLQFTPLHRLELRTTVRQCAYGALIKEADARRILRHIEQDLDDGTLIHQPLDGSHH